MNKQPIRTYAINQEYNEDEQITIIIYMIDICNYNCVYCINEFPRKYIEINIDQLLNFLIKLYNYTKKILLIELAGGEPTLHSKLLDFIINLKKSKIKYELSITTNFSKSFEFYQSIIDISECKFVFSFHVIPNNLINHKNEFINKLSKFNENKLKDFCIRILYNNKYTNYCIDVLNEINNLFHNKIQIEFCQILSTQKYNSVYTKKQLDDYYRELNKIVSFNTQDEYVLEYDDGNKESYNIYEQCVSQNQIFSNYRFWKCDAGFSNYYIHFDGNVFPCANYHDQRAKKLCNINQSYFDMNKICRKTICVLNHCRCEFPLRKEKII